MNHNVSNSNRLFVDRPLTTTMVPVYRASTLRLLSMSDTDLADTTLRVFLMLCLVASLALGALRVSGVSNQDGQGTDLPLPTWSQVNPSAASLPSVQINASFR